MCRCCCRREWNVEINLKLWKCIPMGCVSSWVGTACGQEDITFGNFPWFWWDDREVEPWWNLPKEQHLKSSTFLVCFWFLQSSCLFFLCSLACATCSRITLLTREAQPDDLCGYCGSFQSVQFHGILWFPAGKLCTQSLEQLLGWDFGTPWHSTVEKYSIPENFWGWPLPLMGFFLSLWDHPEPQTWHCPWLVLLVLPQPQVWSCGRQCMLCWVMFSCHKARARACEL